MALTFKTFPAMSSYKMNMKFHSTNYRDIASSPHTKQVRIKKQWKASYNLTFPIAKVYLA